MILALGAFLGFIAVAFGAFAEHGLRENVSNEHFRFLMTAVRYNQVHAVVIAALGLALLHDSRLSTISAFKWSGILFLVGTVLFSFSIYLSVWLGIPALLSATPVGGITIMAAWLSLAFASLIAVRNRNV